MASVSGQDYLSVTESSSNISRRQIKCVKLFFSIAFCIRFSPVIPESKKDDCIHNCWHEFYDYRHEYALEGMAD